jgi:hypothetical protein
LLACAWNGSILGELADGAPSLFEGSALRVSDPMFDFGFDFGEGLLDRINRAWRHIPELCAGCPY